MGKAYSEESRELVKQLLQQDVAEDEIEKQTGVSDRTIRRWKLELERYGRIGKPPESRTGRHRVMNKDVEQALFDHVAQKPDLSVDDMLWWLYDNYKLVVGTRTIRRAFERRNTSHKKFRNDARKDMRAERGGRGVIEERQEETVVGGVGEREREGGEEAMGVDDGDERDMGDERDEEDPTALGLGVSMKDSLVAHIDDHDHDHDHDHHIHNQDQMHPAAQEHDHQQSLPMSLPVNAYQSPYAPMAPMVNNNGAPSEISPELARALGGLTHAGDSNIHPDLMAEEMELSEDEETLQLQLQQIALQRREVELKLKIRRMQRANRSPYSPRILTDANEQSFMADLNAVSNQNITNSLSSSSSHPAGMGATPPNKHRDSRSKSKVEQARRRTEERQERMLKDLERRSRRRENLTAEWVQSRDVWAKGPEKLLVDLMHQHSTYAYNQNSLDAFDAIFQRLYQLVDHTDWYPPVHDDLLRERTRRKMSQLRSKMVKSGEIISRGEGYGGWTRSSDLSGINVGVGIDDDDATAAAAAVSAAGAMPLGHDMQHVMSGLPLDMAAALGGGDGRDHSHAHHHQQQQQQQQHSEEAIIARDAMMHTTPHHHHHQQQHHHPHHHHHQSFQQQQQQQQMYPQDMQHSDFCPSQPELQDAEMNRQGGMAM